MHESFEFRPSPEGVLDEYLIERWPILNLILAAVLRTSVRYSPETKLSLTGQDIAKLIATGLPDNVVLRAIAANDIELDVSAALAETHFFPRIRTLVSGNSCTISKKEEALGRAVPRAK